MTDFSQHKMVCRLQRLRQSFAVKHQSAMGQPWGGGGEGGGGSGGESGGGGGSGGGG